jgi:hypothetical protein
MVALGRAVLSKRERVVMLQPWGKGLLGTTLRYPYEVRDDKAYFDDIGETQIPKDMLALAEHILETKAAKFDPSNFHDRYEAAIVAMLNEKKAGMPVSKQRQLPRIVAGTDLMAALRQSIESAKEAAPKPAAAVKPGPATKPVEPAKVAAVAPQGKKATKRNAGQREMLLPLAGAQPPRKRRKNSRRSPACGRRPDSRITGIRDERLSVALVVLAARPLPDRTLKIVASDERRTGRRPRLRGRPSNGSERPVACHQLRIYVEFPLDALLPKRRSLASVAKPQR